ncbi:protein phosphatase CheZ [Desulfurivibrio sp. D14AmB]|uniref:protein phosphatase CheZ n=1 Tax=Desulfurivibrio sp. D14AmB TaxID=3374370 RepID=UPI00376F326A
MEVSTGFFRITTDNLLYNITVLGGAAVAPAPASIPPPSPPPATDGAMAASCSGDDFYKQVSNNVFNDIGKLAKSLSATIMDLPAEDRKMKRADLDEAGEKIEDAKNQLRDIVSMTERAAMEIMDHVEKVQLQTEDVRALLSQLKNHQAFNQSAGGEEGDDAEQPSGPQPDQRFDQLAHQLTRAGELLEKLAVPPPAAPEEEVAEEAAPAGRRRYLFELDTIFQTIYELCTNEAVKGHISAAREKAGELFDYDAFVEAISAKADQLEPDSDNFYTIPLTDVLGSLAVSCSEQKIKNLFVKMEANQKEIFLDSSLPLEVPPVEEAAVASAVAPAPAVAGPAAPDPEVMAEMREVLAAAAGLVGTLREEPPQRSGGLISREDQLDLFHKIEGAFASVNSIYEDVTRITESLSFQDLSGQQILKIIKLLSDFQMQLLAIVVSFGSQLKSKERNAEITADESKRLAQGDVDRYLGAVAGDGEEEMEGPLDQETVNKMLEDFGF